MKIKFIFLLLLLLLYGFGSTRLVNVYNVPSIEQQEQMFRLEENQLNIKDLGDFEEVGREFVRKRTYIIYYSYKDEKKAKKQIIKNINNRFLNNNWRYTGGFEMNDGSLESEFAKEKCICIVIVKDKTIIIKFRYKI